MSAAINTIIVGQNDSLCHLLRQKLVKSGIECVSVANELMEAALSQMPAAPDFVFLRSDNGRALNPSVLPQIRRFTSADVIGVGNINDSREIVQLMRAGVSDYVHESELQDDQIQNFLNRLKSRGNHHANHSHGNIISVVSASGGCGASTIAVNIAASLTNRKIKNILVDLKQDGGDLSAILNLKPQHTLLDLSQQIEELDGEMLDKSLINHHSGIRLLACSDSFENAGMIQAEVVDKVIHEARSKFGTVIFDVEDVHHREQLAAVRSSHAILLVVRLDLACLVRVRRILDYLERIGIAGDKIKLVANRYGCKNELPKNTVLKALGKSLSYVVPDDYPLAVLASNVGNPILNESPNSQLAKAISQMSESLVTA